MSAASVRRIGRRDNMPVLPHAAGNRGDSGSYSKPVAATVISIALIKSSPGAIASIPIGRCDFCRNSGVSGRKAIFEMLVVDDEIKTAIQERAPAAHLKKLMAEKGESTLFEKAVREAGAGVIALEEACKFRDQPASLL